MQDFKVSETIQFRSGSEPFLEYLILNTSEEFTFTHGNAHVHIGPAFAMVKILACTAGHPPQREGKKWQVDRAFDRDLLIHQERPRNAHQNTGKRGVYVYGVNLLVTPPLVKPRVNR